MTYEQTLDLWLDNQPIPFPTPGHERAWKLLRMLKERSGFDHWWHKVDAETKEEIWQEMASLSQ